MGDFRGWLSVAAIMIGGALAGFLGYRFWHSHRSPPGELPGGASTPIAAASDVPPGALLPGPPITRPGAAQATPTEVPDITLPGLDGQARSLRSFLGHPLIINFWATWCAPCRREIPLLELLRQRYRPEGLEVVGIAVDFEAAVRDYVTRLPVTYPVLIGEDQGMMAAEKFGMQPVLPFSVFVQPDGRILAVRVGELHQDEAEYILQALHSVSAAERTIDDARAAIAEHLRTLAIERARNGES